jgi:transposase-like protein
MCPACKSTRVRRSQSHLWRDRLMKFAGFLPYRCRDCQKRFFVDDLTDTRLQRERERRKGRTAA